MYSKDDFYKKGKSKSTGKPIPKALGKCFNYGKRGHFRKECKTKAKSLINTLVSDQTSKDEIFKLLELDRLDSESLSGSSDSEIRQIYQSSSESSRASSRTSSGPDEPIPMFFLSAMQDLQWNKRLHKNLALESEQLLNGLQWVLSSVGRGFGGFDQSLQLDVSKELNLMELLNCIFCPLWSGSKALQMYEEMRLEHIQSTDVTLLSLLHACCHVGLVERAMALLESMAKDHGLSPRSEHYACVVDLLGWAGLLTKAKHFIDELPVNWQALLGSCSIHGRWKEKARTIKRMREMRWQKKQLVELLSGFAYFANLVGKKILHDKTGNLEGI
ncbi:pentatricopeptide repeat-containing protein [Quercus suber]|uniref:Pentatricopeptide repeat-containing protein n=1 Tax=Quercus suber TaxID=58331 RepID=A0AAW0K6N7_QUESU